MKPAPFEFHTAATVEEAVRLLASLGSEAKVLAGGQSLGPLLNYRVVRPSALIDVRRIEALRAAQVAPDGVMRLGAAVTHAAIEDGRVADGTQGFLRSVARGIAYRAIRNRGTIGGSLAHSDPSADWPVVMSALNAGLQIASRNGLRTVAARAFHLGSLETVLKPDDLLVRIDIPKPKPRSRIGFAKSVRKAGEFADSIAAVVIQMDGRLGIAAADVWLGAAAATPLRVKNVEDLLAGQQWDERLRRELPAAVAAALPTPTTAYERFKMNLHGVMIARALDDAHNRSLAA